MRERRRDYEMMIIVSPLVGNDEGVTAIVDRLKQTIEDLGGEVTGVNHSPPWGRRKLAYPIREYVTGEASRRSFNEGFYVLMHFSLAAAQMLEVERTLKLTDTILRHLITLVEVKGAVQNDEEATDEPVAEATESE